MAAPKWAADLLARVVEDYGQEPIDLSWRRSKAQEHVREARQWAQARDPWCDFDAFGVSEHPETIPTPLMRRDG